jgi:cytochrome d ubiquinol oxidase subunit II
MIASWYAVVSFMLIVYVVLDGRNFGAGMLHWFVAETPEERRQVIAAVGPLWPWHEVWLIGFGGTLLAIFPRLMASAFAGYYLALFLILWCLIVRGIALEVVGHIENRLWQSYWDLHFSLASFLLAILFGAAAGNVARGVPIDADGNFSMPFFTDFNVRGNVGLLDWYTVSIAICATVMLAAHGATYLTLKTEGPVHDRCEKCAKRLWVASIPLLLVILIESKIVRPDLPGRAFSNPFCWFGLVLVVFSIVRLVSGFMRHRESRAFAGSNLLIVGLLSTGSAAIFPVMLHSTLAPEHSLTAYAVASNPSTLRLTAIWWPIGLALAVLYSIFISRRYVGKVGVERNTETSCQGSEP